MKGIGHIYLSWREGLGKRRHIVGVIKRNVSQGVVFTYLADGIEKAKADGFSHYTEFPDLTKKYTSNVLDVFAQRIIKTERSDIGNFLDFWEIDPQLKDNKLYLLAHTQGLNPADNFEFLADYKPNKNLRFLTDLAGLSKLQLKSNTLIVGDVLSYKLETENKYDHHAVKVFKGEQEIGYIKKIHSRVFHKLKRHKLNLEVKAIEQNGIIKRIFVKVNAM